MFNQTEAAAKKRRCSAKPLCENKMKIGDTKKAFKFIFFLLIATSIMMFIFGGRTIYNAVKTYNWPSTLGIVVVSSVAESSTGRTLYWPELHYKYTHNGKEYISTQFTTAKVESYSPNRPSEIVKAYPVGKQITIYYNPLAPSESVIQKYTMETWIPLICSIGILFFSVIILPRLA